MIYIPIDNRTPDIWVVIGELPAVARLDIHGERARLAFHPVALRRRATLEMFADAQRFFRENFGFERVIIDIDPAVDPPPHLVLVPTEGARGGLYFASDEPTFSVGFALEANGFDDERALRPIAPFVAEEHRGHFAEHRVDFLDLAARKFAEAGVLPFEFESGSVCQVLSDLWNCPQ